MPRSKKDGIDPATRTFQALRIAVNDELGELERLLKATPDLLADGGALVVVSFHSLEDKIVKNFMRGKVKSVSRHEPIMPHNERSDNAPPLSIVSRKAILPTEEEKKINPRARSARLRAAVKLMSEGDD